MIALKKLKDEIQNDPLTRGYSGMSDQALTDSLNVADRAVKVPIPSNIVLSWSGSNQRYSKIEAGILTGANDDIKNICKIAIKLIDRDGTQFDPNNTDHTGMLTALVGGGVLDANDQSTLLALGDKTLSRAEELGVVSIGDEVFIGHVKQARSLL